MGLNEGLRKSTRLLTATGLRHTRFTRRHLANLSLAADGPRWRADTSRRRSPWRAAQWSVDFLSNALPSARAPSRGRWRITKKFGTARLHLSKTTSKGKFDTESFHLFRR